MLKNRPVFLNTLYNLSYMINHVMHYGLQKNVNTTLTNTLL